MDPKQNRPKARDKKVTSGGSGVHKRGDGLGTGKVGSADYSAGQSAVGGGSTAKRAAIGGGGGIAIIALLAMLLFKGGGLGGLLGGGGGSSAFRRGSPGA